MLLKLFLKKMKKSLSELEDAISVNDYEKIALISHSIKGSSGNFRIDSLQKFASEMEQNAKNKEKYFSYKQFFVDIKNEIEKIKIS
jgi:HPt (histidine-containing phosphotransfer) domain-containing protein